MSSLNKLKQKDYNMFLDSFLNEHVPVQDKIDREKFKKAMKSKFFRDFIRQHHQSMEK